jgi:hypothetical protein
MANLIAIVGGTGEGKSTSIRNLNPKETFIINVAGKDLPFKGFRKKYTPFETDKEKGNFYSTSSVETIGKILKFISTKRPDIKTVIIDDVQYIMSFEAMDRSKEKNFDKHVDIANNYYTVLKESKNMREDMNVIVTSHSLDEKDNYGNVISRRIKTLGAMLDKYITIEGLFTYVLFTEKIVFEDEQGNTQTRYTFKTNDPTNFTTAKTPMGCFEELNIDNDLQIVLQKIKEYNEE